LAIGVAIHQVHERGGARRRGASVRQLCLPVHRNDYAPETAARRTTRV